MAGDKNIFEKFFVPVKNANIVPSIEFGVILAKSAIIGKTNSVKDKVLKVTSVKNKTLISDNPIYKLYLLAKQ